MTTATDTAALRLRLVNELVRNGAIRSSWVLSAFNDTPREVFVPRFHRAYPETGVVDGADPDQAGVWLEQVYTDRVLVVQHRNAADDVEAPTSSSSQPTVMAGMLEALDLHPGHRVLEIGTGTGFNTALLCRRVGAENVVSVELDPSLAEAARAALAGLGLKPTVYAGDGATVLDGAGPFDRIIATAAVDHIPPAWIEQLASGGVIVTDLRGSVTGSLIRLTADTDGDQVDSVQGRFLELPGAFMPMRSDTDTPYRDREQWARIVYDFRNPQRTTTHENPVLVTDDDSLRFLVQLHLAGYPVRLAHRPAPDNELSGRAIDGSNFTASLEADQGVYAVAQAGPRRLWDSAEAAYATWRRLGQPGIGRFGVTAGSDPDLQFVWWDHPDSGYRWPLPL